MNAVIPAGAVGVLVPGKLLVSVVRRGAGERVVMLAKRAGAPGSTVLRGRGTAQSRILRLLCLADTEKELVFTLADSRTMPAIVSAVRHSAELCRKTPGIGFVIDVAAIARSIVTGAATDRGAAPSGGTMNPAPGHTLICAIVNAGLADDLMLAARAAGARGGTILKARGTGTEEDATFFGITIVPEKELLMVLAADDAAPAIFDAVRGAPCLSEPGAGIAFCLAVERFFPLGADRN